MLARSMKGGALASVIMVAALGSACSKPEVAERVGFAQLPLGSDDEICWAEVGALPSIAWSHAFEGIDSVSTLNLEIDNPYGFAIDVGVTLASHGLDQRIVKRALGSVQIAAGTSTSYEIDLAALPIQSVSYSSLAVVELDVDRGADSIAMVSAPFHYHFDEAYQKIYVYDFDTMLSELAGGQLSDNAFELQGRVWDAAGYSDIAELRASEELPMPWSGSVDVVLYDEENPPPPPEPPPPGEVEVEVCFNWRTRFFDVGLGEDDATTEWIQTLRAPHALVEIRKVVYHNCLASSPNDPCLYHVWTGYLDSDGCVDLPDDDGDYLAWVTSRFEVDRSPQLPFVAELTWWDDSNVERGLVSKRTPFSINTQPNVMVWIPFVEFNNPNAVLSKQLAAPDLAVVDNLLYGQAPSLHVHAYRTSSPQSGIPSDDARAVENKVITGKWIRDDNGKPGGLQFKSVLAHELGHVHNYLGTYGWAISDRYNVDSPSQALCRCDHVDGSNALHCLQSREQIGVAQVEGLGQFFSAKTWNDPSGADCTFINYKEFLLTASGPPEMVPNGKDCLNAYKWRNNECFDATRGTELDWMQFYWNINTQGSYTTKLSDLWPIYRAACGGLNCGGTTGVTWATLRQAAENYFVNNPFHRVHFVAWGDDAGVSTDSGL